MMTVQKFCDWLAATPVSQAFADAAWFVPTVQSVHILSIAAVVSTVVLLDVRLLRLTRRGPPLADMARYFLPWTWVALVLLLISGTLLTITEPSRELMNIAFRVKMLLVVVLTALMLVVQGMLRKEPGYWSATAFSRFLGSLIGGASLAATVVIVFLGRLIAYV
jgi:hypothetical protein